MRELQPTDFPSIGSPLPYEMVSALHASAQRLEREFPTTRPAVVLDEIAGVAEELGAAYVDVRSLPMIAEGIVRFRLQRSPEGILGPLSTNARP